MHGTYPNGQSDRSYIGVPFVFAGIANGCIYLLDTFQERKIMPCDAFSTGWAYWRDPEQLYNGLTSFSIEDLQKALQQAIQDEDYEVAEQLRRSIEEFKNKGH